ncbi:candidapepsin-3 precursor [Apiospora sp. TS-2023a]
MRLFISILAFGILGLSLTEGRDELQQILSQPKSALPTVELREVTGYPVGIVALAAVGTPPQPVRLLIDLLEGPFFLPSAELATYHSEIGDDSRIYFGNGSTTYASWDPKQFRDQYGVFWVQGPLATDTLRIAGLDLPHQPFLHADSYDAFMIDFFMTGYDGVLCLSPHTADDSSPFPSPWFTMVRRGMLERKLLAMSIPNEAAGNTGALTFGGIDPAYASSPFRSIPLVGNGEAWSVPLRSLGWADASDPLHHDFPAGATAVLTTETYVAVPRSFQRRWASDVVLGCDAMDKQCEVDCARRTDMPDVVVGLGDHEFRIKAFQYAAPVVREDGREMCVLSMMDIDQVLDPPRPDGGVELLFGLPFLRAFYSVFDLDQREIRLTEKLAV